MSVDGLSSMQALAMGLDAPPPVVLVLWSVGLAMSLGVLGLIGWLAHLVLTLPLRRRERARLFLHLVARGLAQGTSIEQTIVTLSRRGVGVLGRGLHGVARELEEGVTLTQALDWRPGFLPPRLVEMLVAGERAGDVARVLPACRKTLGDERARLRSAMHYFILIALGLGSVFAATLVVLPGIGIYVLPRFQEMWVDMRVEMPPLFGILYELTRNPLVYLVLWSVPLALLVGAFLYGAGPWLVPSLRLQEPASWVQRLVPWQWKRVQRDFSAMLGVLLDAGLPEAEAVVLAARSTTNRLLMRRADRVARALEQGTPLTEAVARLDRSGEFRWRLTTAAQAGKGFAAALEGWHESLDARAFQQQQATAQIVTSAIVLVNGAIVAAIAIGVFQLFTSLIRGMTSW